MMIKWLDDAIFDLKALREYIAQDKPSAANRVAKRILNAVNLLSGQSGMGRAGRVSGTRELVIPGFPYIIPYRVKNNSIEILRVLHAAMHWREKIPHLDVSEQNAFVNDIEEIRKQMKSEHLEKAWD